MSNTKLPELPEPRLWYDAETRQCSSMAPLRPTYDALFDAGDLQAYARQALADRERQAGEAVAWMRDGLDGTEYCEKPFTTDWTPLYTLASLPAPQAVQAVERFAQAAHWYINASEMELIEHADTRERALRRVHQISGELLASGFEFIAAAPSPDGKDEQAEAPRSASTCGYAQCQGKPKCDFCEYGKIIDQPTASNAGEREAWKPVVLSGPCHHICWMPDDEETPEERVKVVLISAADYDRACAALATQPPASNAGEREENEVGKLEYMGNSVAFIYQKMKAYQSGIDAVWGALRSAGIQPDGKTTAAQAIAALSHPSTPQADALDAARYRKLCEYNIVPSPSLWDSGVGFLAPFIKRQRSQMTKAELDAELDAAMAARKGGTA